MVVADKNNGKKIDFFLPYILTFIFILQVITRF